MNAESEFAPTDPSFPVIGGGTPILDDADLLRRCLGKRDFAQRLLDKLVAKLPGKLSDLEAMCRDGRCPDVALLAHELKGATLSIAAKNLAAALTQLEAAARAEQETALPELFRQTALQAARLTAHLEHHKLA